MGKEDKNKEKKELDIGKMMGIGLNPIIQSMIEKIIKEIDQTNQNVEMLLKLNKAIIENQKKIYKKIGDNHE